MATLETLKRQVDATEDLQSVVKTMKALAAVNIRQYEEAATSLRDYRRTVELALRALLRDARSRRPSGRLGSDVAAMIVVGTDQGMCGQFNEDVARHAVRRLRRQGGSAFSWKLLVVGEKLAAALEARGQAADRVHNVPGSAGAITSHVRDLLAAVERWQTREGPLRQVVLVYNGYAQQAVTPRDTRLLPLDESWLQQLQEKRWPTKEIPLFTTPPEQFLSHLVQQYLFVQFFGALAESLAAENTTRLRAMQSAEKNVEERLDDLTTRFNRQRQNSITAELLDVIAGSEAVAE